MLSELRLANFRCFDDEVMLRIRPITILIGKNNAGKSSLIKLLLMLKQSANRPGKSYLLPNSDEVKLGALNELKNLISNKRKQKRNLRDLQNLRFDLRAKEMGSPSDKFFDLARNHSTQKALENLEYLIRVSVSYDENLSHGEVLIQSVINDDDYIGTHYKSAISPNSVFLREIKPGRENGAEDENQIRLGEECASNIAQSLEGVAHLSAARKELPLEISQYRKDMGYVGKEGQDALFCLWKEDILSDKKKKKFLLRHTNKILNIDNLEIVEGRRLVVTEARNSETGADPDIANFGFGVSQCLPIFVQGLMMDPYSHLIVEQPEAQVHPTAQLDLASFFVDLWNKRDVGSIIETHSGNLILRLRREVARNKLKPEHVSIAYISSDDSHSNPTPVIRNLDINSDGSLQEGLPMEFFNKNIEEALNMRIGE